MRRHSSGGSSGKSARLVVGGYALLLAAWVLGSAPFSSPDEWSHYLRALGIAQGQLVGAPVPDYRDPHLDPPRPGRLGGPGTHLP